MVRTKRIFKKMMRAAGLIFLLGLLPIAAWAANEGKMIEVILDASGSMNGKLAGGEMKIAAAKSAVSELVKKMPDGAVLSFRAYGHQSLREKHDCQDTELLVPFGPLSKNRGQIEAKAKGLTAKGYTPITYVITKGAEDFQADFQGDKLIVLVKVEKTGPGWLEVKGADLSGHQVTRADTGEKVGSLGHTQSSMELPAGIYNVTIGRAVWKSVEVKAGEKTVLAPGFLKVEHATVQGHKIVDPETGAIHGEVGNTKNNTALMPGEYEVYFGKLGWPVKIKAGETLVLKPGTVQVVRASVQGNKIRNKKGEVIGEVSNTMNWIPLPPGEYTVELQGKSVPFSLKEGEELKFQ